MTGARGSELASLKQLDEMAASVKRPMEARTAINDAFDEIERRGLVPGIGIGEMAPDFTLSDATGDRVRLADRLAAGPVVLLFYRGSWCPYCNLELRAYQEALPQFEAFGASLIAVSPQLPDDAMSMAEKHALAYDVLSDAEQLVIAAYRIGFDLPPHVTEHMLDTTLAALAKQQPDESGQAIILITHDIDEAIYLADTVIVLGGAPASVIDTIRVPFGPKRDQLTTKALPEFAELRSRVHLLIHDASRAMHGLSLEETK